jgi:uncharacterized membrane protein
MAAEAAILAIPGAVDALGMRATLRGICHQDPGRSLRIAGHLMPVCARCAGLHFGVISAFLAILLARKAPRARVRWAALAIGVLLIAAATLLESGLEVDTGFPVRVASGLALGIPIGIVLGSATMRDA